MAEAVPTFEIRNMEPDEIETFISICRQNAIWSIEARGMLCIYETCKHVFLVAISPSEQIVGTCCLFYVTPERCLISGLGSLLDYKYDQEVKTTLLQEAVTRVPSGMVFDMILPSSMERYIRNCRYKVCWEIHLYIAHSSTLCVSEVTNKHGYQDVLTSQGQSFIFHYSSSNGIVKTMLIDDSGMSKEIQYLIYQNEYIVGYGEIFRSGKEELVIGPVIANNQLAANYLWKALLLHIKQNKLSEKIFTYVPKFDFETRKFLKDVGFLRAKREWVRYTSNEMGENTFCDLTYSDANRMMFAYDSIFCTRY